MPWCQQAACHVTANVRLVLLICRPAGRHAVAVSTPKGRVTPWHQRQLLLSPYNLQGGRHTVLCLSGVCVPRAAVCSGDCGAAVTAEEVGRSCYRLLIFQLSPSCRCNAKYTQLCTHVRTVPCVLMKGGRRQCAPACPSSSWVDYAFVSSVNVGGFACTQWAGPEAPTCCLRQCAVAGWAAARCAASAQSKSFAYTHEFV